MSLWLMRAGKYGEYETNFIEDSKVYLTWEDFANEDMSTVENYAGIRSLVEQKYPGELNRGLGNWAGQIWAFVIGVKEGDWVVFPRKASRTVAIGIVKSRYKFDLTSEILFRHSREIQWLNTEVPRASFDQDLLYSFGAFLTVCEIKRNDAEARVKAMASNGWITPRVAATTVNTGPTNSEQPFDVQQGVVDLEQLARDSIAELIIQKFKGHGMARLVEDILRAQGFTTYLSPEGPDRGLDILASSGPFGFDSPRICVQVKSGDTPAGTQELNQLIGVIQNVNADQGLFVSWSDFKQTVHREIPKQFFKVRLWNQNDLIDQILLNYHKLSLDIKAELPFKQIWTIASPEV